jgi:lysozyme
MLPGIDVSNNNGQIDWGAVAGAGYGFAVAKASEGTDFVDSYFAANWAGMKANGMVRGAYHFARPDDNSAENEANYFLDTIQAQVGDLEAGDFLALDLEVGSGDLGAWALQFLQTVYNRAGFRPMLYCSPGFMDSHGITSQQALADFGLWLADWEGTEPNPPAPWQLLALWQDNDDTTVAGIAGNVDGDYFNGTRDELVRYGKPS